ncbi:origin recognition complex subunit 3 N-terminus-domain-containing protein [Phycomyces nitens]|nr:origin recognition complex subunit 3 N-terminus-domain-containing protein [Phycomyces nitens]
MEMRRKGFENTWKKTEDLVEGIMLDMNHTCLNNISQFVDRAYDTESSAKSLIALPYHEIPTGLVFAGINTPDHATPFAQLTSMLASPATTENKRTRDNYVALLQSKDCNTLQIMMTRVIEQFLASKDPLQKSESMDIDNVNEDDDEDDEDSDNQEKHENSNKSYVLTAHSGDNACRLQRYDLQMLEGWYNHQMDIRDDKSTPRPNLVIILQDFESFAPDVLQNFITICSEYRLRIPIVFIIGIATSTEILHQSLSKSTLGLLRIEKFWLQLSEAWFNRVIETVFIDTPYTIKFGARPYKFMLDHFYLYDFSMGAVKSSLKYALMHCFYGSSLSIFLPLLGQERSEILGQLQEWQKRKLLTEDHINTLRMQPSFKAYIESICDTEPSKALRLVTDDEFFATEAMADFLCGIETYRQGFKFGLDLIQVLQGQFSAFSTLRKSKRMLLLQSLETRDGLVGGDSNHSEVTRWLVSLVRKVEPDALESLLDALEGLMESNPEYKKRCMAVIDGESRYRLPIWKKRLVELLGGDDEYVARMEKKAKRLEGMSLPDLEEKRNTETSKKVHAEAIAHMKRKGTETSKLAMEISDWVHHIFYECLQSYTQVPMHELAYYVQSKLHEKSFSAQPRASVQTALTNSKHYLDCQCCQGGQDQLLPSEPDSCILYKLYLECGRLINLYDWFVAFGCIIEREKRPADNLLSENEVQARFIRSVAELQFLGFIKPTQRKTDHVMRLTWSNI